MKKTLHRSDERGCVDHGWLKSCHSFSFAGYHDPEKMHFGLLRVLNDDTVAGGKGFGMHPHDNMEIITIPLAGVLEHSDTTGNARQLRPGEVQIMSAGRGLQHSEYNGSRDEPVQLLQIWIYPKVKNIEPRYDQKKFDDSLFVNKFHAVASPEKGEDTLWINQDAALSLASFQLDKKLMYSPAVKKDNGVYFFVIEGTAEIAGEQLGRRDAIGISDFESVEIRGEKGSRLLAIEVPMA